MKIFYVFSRIFICFTFTIMLMVYLKLIFVKAGKGTGKTVTCSHTVY